MTRRRKNRYEKFRDIRKRNLTEFKTTLYTGEQVLFIHDLHIVTDKRVIDCREGYEDAPCQK